MQNIRNSQQRVTRENKSLIQNHELRDAVYQSASHILSHELCAAVNKNTRTKELIVYS